MYFYPATNDKKYKVAGWYPMPAPCTGATNFCRSACQGPFSVTYCAVLARVQSGGCACVGLGSALPWRLVQSFGLVPVSHGMGGEEIGTRCHCYNILTWSFFLLIFFMLGQNWTTIISLFDVATTWFLAAASNTNLLLFYVCFRAHVAECGWLSLNTILCDHSNDPATGQVASSSEQHKMKTKLVWPECLS